MHMVLTSVCILREGYTKITWTCLAQLVCWHALIGSAGSCSKCLVPDAEPAATNGWAAILSHRGFALVFLDGESEMVDAHSRSIPSWKSCSQFNRNPSCRRMLCLYGTRAQKQKMQKIRAARGQGSPDTAESRSQRKRLEDKQLTGVTDGLEAAFQVLGPLWLQEALGCRRLPFALSKKYLVGFTGGLFKMPRSCNTDAAKKRFPASLPQLCFRCSVEERLNKAMSYLKSSHLEVERQNEALAEQYALAKERRESAQCSAQLAAKLGLCTDTHKEKDNDFVREQTEQRRSSGSKPMKLAKLENSWGFSSWLCFHPIWWHLLTRNSRPKKPLGTAACLNGGTACCQCAASYS